MSRVGLVVGEVANTWASSGEWQRLVYPLGYLRMQLMGPLGVASVLSVSTK